MSEKYLNSEESRQVREFVDHYDENAADADPILDALDRRRPLHRRSRHFFPISRAQWMSFLPHSDSRMKVEWLPSARLASYLACGRVTWQRQWATR
jgi:hypothetical protein